MAGFSYEAMNSRGEVVTGFLSVDSVAEVEERLIRKGLSPLNVRHTTGGKEEEAVGAATAPSWFERFQGVRIDDLILLCRQLSTMLAAGIVILQALRIIGNQVRNPLLRGAALDIADKVEGGARLSEAFSAHSAIFSPLFFNMVRVGEETGSLDRSFDYLARLHENEKSIKTRIKSATSYPKIVVSALAIAIIFLMTFVMPRFVGLFSSSRLVLPLPTRILIAGSNFITGNMFLLVLITVSLVVIYRVALRHDGFIMARDRLRLRLPVFGDLGIKIYMSRFCRVFSVLTVSGVDIVRVLDLAGAALENRVLAQMMEKVRNDVEQGRHLSEAMGDFPLFPSLVKEMLAVGEQSGRMDEMMVKVADYYDTESDYTIKNLSTMIEPVLLLTLGSVVAIFALAIFMPMWDMMSVVKGGG